jgi:iron complex transport system ATP-binding protein
MSIVLSNVISGYEEFMLKSINLTIQKGSYAALIGPNGCGKSTLLKTIGQITKLKSGSITVDGNEIHRLPAKTVARQIAFLPQSPVVPTGISVEQLVGYGRAPHQSLLGIRSRRDVEIVEEALHTSGLYTFKDRALKDLSGGQRQRAFIAMCLAQDTPYIMLDEPTSYLDIRYQYETLDLLQQLNSQGRTVVVVLHDIAQASRYADHLVVMRDGAIFAEGTPHEVVSPSLVSSVYEINTSVYADPVSQTPVVTPV